MKKKILILLFVILLVGGVIAVDVILDNNHVGDTFTQLEYDEIEIRGKDFVTVFDKHLNGSIVFDECPNGSSNCYVTITQEVYREEIIINESEEVIDGKTFRVTENIYTNKIVLINITEKIKYIPEMWEGKDDPNLLIYLENKRLKAVDREEARSLTLQSPSARVVDA